MDAAEQASLDAEWRRAQGGGRVLARKRAIATLASMATVFVLLVPTALFAVFVSLDPRVLAISALGALAAGWWVRKRLWPRGQFA